MINHYNSLTDEKDTELEGKSPTNKEGHLNFCFDSCSVREISASAVIDQISDVHNNNSNAEPVNASNMLEKFNSSTEPGVVDLQNLTIDVELLNPEAVKNSRSANLIDGDLIFGEFI